MATDLTENSSDVRRVIYAGGTIGCAGSPLTPLPGPVFRDRCVAAGMLAGARWEWTEPALDSAAMGPADWLGLATRVLAEEGPAILLHGTDTMAWTAAALAILLTELDAEGAPIARLPEPVVLTGAQRPLLAAEGIDPASDAPANLRAAEAEALSGRPGVWLAFGGRVLPGARTAKRATLADAAFEAPMGWTPAPALPPAGRARLADQAAEIACGLGARRVITLVATPDAPDALAEHLEAAMAAVGARLGAVHLLGTGLGTLPDERALAPLIARATARGVLVALGTQVPEGPVDPVRYGAGAWAVAAGAVPTGDMTVPAAGAKLRILLALAASRGWDRDRLARAFARPIAGEIGA